MYKSHTESNRAKTSEKNMTMGPWDVVRELFSASSFRSMSFADKIDHYYQDYGQDAIKDVIQMMDDYYLTKEDYDILLELGIGPNDMKALMQGIPTAVKSEFTRTWAYT
jgi:hypothetical protein